MVARRERALLFCARVALDAPARGRSASPLEAAPRIDYAAKATSSKSQGKDPSFDVVGLRARTVPSHQRAVWELHLPTLRLRLALVVGVCAEEGARAQ